MRFNKSIILLCFLFCGCSSRADKHIINGLTALEMATIKVVEHNHILYNEKIERLRAELANESDPEKILKIEKEINDEIEWLLANEKIPVAVGKLKDWAENK